MAIIHVQEVRDLPDGKLRSYSGMTVTEAAERYTALFGVAPVDIYVLADREGHKPMRRVYIPLPVVEAGG